MKLVNRLELINRLGLAENTEVVLAETNRYALIKVVPLNGGGADLYIEAKDCGFGAGVLHPTEKDWSTLRRDESGALRIDL